MYFLRLLTKFTEELHFKRNFLSSDYFCRTASHLAASVFYFLCESETPDVAVFTIYLFFYIL